MSSQKAPNSSQIQLATPLGKPYQDRTSGVLLNLVHQAVRPGIQGVVKALALRARKGRQNMFPGLAKSVDLILATPDGPRFRGIEDIAMAQLEIVSEDPFLNFRGTTDLKTLPL